jgi:hypothetical protein
MGPLDIWNGAKEVIMAYPLASFILFAGGMGLGWTACFAFAHREVKLHRILIEELRRPDIAEKTKNDLLASAPRSHRVSPWLRSLGSILVFYLLAAMIGVAVSRVMVPSGPFVRQLTAKQEEKMRPILKSDQNEQYAFQINTIPSCEECELYAEDMRDFFNDVEGWKASGSPLIFSDPLWRTGVYVVVRRGEENSAAVQKIKAAFRAAEIKFYTFIEDLPAGTFVVVIARQKYNSHLDLTEHDVLASHRDQ